METKVSKQELEVIGNRQVNITYILCGCLENSFDDMIRLLELSNQDLRFNNKKLMNELIKLSKRFRFLVDELQKSSVLTLTDGTIYSHDVSLSIFYSLMMKFVMLTGVDEYYDFRAYKIFELLSKYKNQIEFPHCKVKDSQAWDFIKRQIANGEISESELKTLLVEKDENGATED